MARRRQAVQRALENWRVSAAELARLLRDLERHALGRTHALDALDAAVERDRNRLRSRCVPELEEVAGREPQRSGDDDAGPVRRSAAPSATQVPSVKQVGSATQVPSATQVGSAH